MIKAVFLDLDGTVYRGKDPCPDAAAAIKTLHAEGYGIRYLTNNSAARPAEVTQKLASLGIPCEPNWVLSSGMVTGRIIVRSHKSVAVIGNPGLHESLQESGLQLVDFAQAEAVVVGICHDFNYKMLQRASDEIRTRAAFYATNQDSTYPYDNGRLAPGAGSIVAAVQTASGITPITIGKPEPHMVFSACRELRINPPEALFAGDRLDTDIKCAHAAGCHPWLVLTGVTTEKPGDIPGSPTLAGLVDYLGSLNS